MPVITRSQAQAIADATKQEARKIANENKQLFKVSTRAMTKVPLKVKKTIPRSPPSSPPSSYRNSMEELIEQDRLKQEQTLKDWILEMETNHNIENITNLGQLYELVNLYGRKSREVKSSQHTIHMIFNMFYLLDKKIVPLIHNSKSERIVLRNYIKKHIDHSNHSFYILDLYVLTGSNKHLYKEVTKFLLKVKYVLYQLYDELALKEY